MANLSAQTTSIVNARAVGTKDAAGNQYGGIYYPAHSKNGKSNPARWEGNVALNGKPYVNSEGVQMPGKATFLRLVVWNGKNSATGLADTFAKCVSVGKELSCNVRINSFEKRMFKQNQPVLDAQGNALTYTAHNFTLEDKLVFGSDSNKTVADEVSKYNGNPTFDSRPQFWNVQGHADQVAWSTIIVPYRKGTVCNPATAAYGYARVIVPEGVVPAAAPQQPAQGVPPTQAALVLEQAKALILAREQVLAQGQTMQQAAVGAEDVPF